MSKCFVFVLLVFMVNPMVVAFEYSAGIKQANWVNKASKLACDLSQSIPNYGEAFFSIRPEQVLQFGIYQQHSSTLEVREASLSSLPAPWKRDNTHLKSYPVFIEKTAQSQYISVFGAEAEAMIDVLLSTEFPVFTYKAKAGSTLENVRVTVSAVNFSQQYTKFQVCRQQLSLYALSSVQDQSIYFIENSKQLDKKAVVELDKIVNFLLNMPETRLIITSETYFKGKNDAKLFKPRAQNMANTLIKKGIDESRISVQTGSLPQAMQSDENIIRTHIFGPDSLKWFNYRKGSAYLSRKEKLQLDLVAQYLKQQNARLIINSHTDFVEGGAKNQSIAQKRGDMIKQYLQSQGIAAEKLRVYAHGKKNPVASNRTREGQARNRRVELKFE